MPQAKAERLAESFLRQLAPAIVGMLDAALKEQEAPASGPNGASAADSESGYIEQRAATQLEKYRAQESRRQSAKSGSPRRRK